ncbi:MAG: helix-turn-helix transcriptional regulator [Thermoanaerobaculia bacterium]
MYGQQIREARTRAGLTQAALAKRAKLSRQQLALIEKGENVSIQVLVRVLRALDLRELYVVDRTRLVTTDAGRVPPTIQEVRAIASRLAKEVSSLERALEGSAAPQRSGPDWFDQLRHRVEQVHEAIASQAPGLNLRAVFQSLDEWIVGAVEDPADTILRSAQAMVLPASIPAIDPHEIPGAEPRRVDVTDLEETAVEEERKSSSSRNAQRVRRP